MAKRTEKKRSVKQILQRTLREILMQEKVRTQQAIQQCLAEKGYTITQSSISRLLHIIGAVKSKDIAGNAVYQMPIEPLPPQPSNSLYSLVVNIVSNETTVVIHTSPGAASLVARGLDHNKTSLGILATLAGDDVIVVVPASIQNIDDIRQKITKMIS